MARMPNRKLGGVLLTTAMFVALPAVALAAPRSSSYQGDTVEYAPTMLVLDASGSMAEADPQGGSKMAAAKRAMGTVIDAMPAEATVGFEVYGTNTGSSDAEKDSGCQDVTVLREPEPIDKAGLTSAVDGLTPRGYTPIGKALQTAADALPAEGPRSIVLVSDGIDTRAPPDPCEVAKTLAERGVDLVVHTVGFGVDAKARQQLTCIAQETGGTYTHAPDGPSLEQVLPRVTAVALRNYEPSGARVIGTKEQRSAPTLEPGQYLDTLAPSEKKYYTVDIPADTTTYFSATIPFERGGGGITDANTLKVEVLSPAGQNCGIRGGYGYSLTAQDGEVVTASVIFDGTNAERKVCNGSGRFGFSVARDEIISQQTSTLPIELQVGLEPKPVGGKGEPATDETVGFAEPDGAPVPAVGGGTFGTAAVLNGSGSYTDTLRNGEFVFYRVKLDWGQGLAYRVQFGESEQSRAANVATRVYSPFRRQVGRAGTVYGGKGKTVPHDKEAVSTLPIRYLNRENKDPELSGQSLAGWYYISVKLGRNVIFKDEIVSVPVQLDISVTGTPEQGPDYQYTSEEARERGVFGENSSGNAGNGNASADTAIDVERTAAGSSSTIAWVLGGTGAAVVLGGLIAALLLLRASRREPPRPLPTRYPDW